MKRKKLIILKTNLNHLKKYSIISIKLKLNLKKKIILNVIKLQKKIKTIIKYNYTLTCIHTYIFIFIIYFN